MPGVTLSKSSATEAGSASGHPADRPEAQVLGVALSRLGQGVIIVLLSVFLIVLNDQLWRFDNQGIRKVRALQASVQEQMAENAQLEERNQALAAQVTSLKQGLDAMEELARTELGMIHQDETFFRVLEEAPPTLSPAQ